MSLLADLGKRLASVGDPQSKPLTCGWVFGFMKSVHVPPCTVLRKGKGYPAALTGTEYSYVLDLRSHTDTHSHRSHSTHTHIHAPWLEAVDRNIHAPWLEAVDRNIHAPWLEAVDRTRHGGAV